MSQESPVISVGPTTVLLADRYHIRCAPYRSPKEQAAWFRRTDYAWICSHAECKDRAGVNYKTPRGAIKGARAHATEHPGATVKELV